MTEAFLYLTVCSARNAILTWFGRLRQLRYSGGLVVGALYFYWFLLRPRRPRATPLVGTAGLLAGPYHGTAEVLAGSFLLVLCAAAWVWPGSERDLLKFSPAEMQFLFPAPVTRRQLVHYKVLRSCVRPALSSAFLTLMLRPAALASAAVIFVGLFIVFETVSLYMMGVALRRQRAPADGRLTLVGRLLPVVIPVLAVGVVAAALIANGPRLAAIGNLRDLAMELGRIGGTAPANIALLPFVALARLPLAGDPMTFLQLLPVPLLLLTAAYVWTVRADVSLEKVARTSTLAEHPSHAPSTAPLTARKSPFRLSPVGRPEMALLWKNMISFGRYATPTLALRLLPVIVILGLVLSRAGQNNGVATALATLCLGLTGYVVLLGPQMMRHDLRADLAHLPTLKSWPLGGATIVRGEVMAPAVVLSVIAWMSTLATLSMSSSIKFAIALPLPERLSFAAAAMLIAPGLILTQVVLQNAIALMFPAWVGMTRSRGVDVVGQRLLMMGGVMIVLVLACLPAAIAAGLVGLAIRAVFGVVPVVVPAAVALMVLLVECSIATEVLGGLFERTDVGAMNP